MKKALKFAGLAAFVLGLVAFILMMATVAIKFEYDAGILGKITGEVEGAVVLFGKTETVLGVEAVTKAAPIALVGWVLIIVALVALCAGVVLPLLKVKGAEKVAGLLNLAAALLLVVAGVLLFFTVSSFCGANKVDKDFVKYYHLAGGWVVAAILAIAGGVVAVVPACVDFLGKKK